jgi:chromosome segregation and condensation protein ScpB
MEVLACIAFGQLVSQAQIGQLFAADKRSLVVRLRDLGLVKEFACSDGRLRFVTTELFPAPVQSPERRATARGAPAVPGHAVPIFLIR